MASAVGMWGHSLAVRLPRWLVERTGIERGDLAYVSIGAEGEIVIKAVKPRAVHPAYKATTVRVVADCPTTKQVAEKW